MYRTWISVEVLKPVSYRSQGRNPKVKRIGPSSLGLCLESRRSEGCSRAIDNEMIRRMEGEGSRDAVWYPEVKLPGTYN